MNPLMLLSGPWAPVVRIALYALLAVAIFGYGWVKGNDHGTAKLSKYIGEQAVASQKLLAARVEVVTQVEERWHTRTEVIVKAGKTIIKEVPRYVTEKDDAACVVPTGFVRLYNAAVAGDPDPGPPTELDRAASGVPLSTVSETDVFNLTLGKLWRARAEQCIETYNAVKAAR